MTYIRQRTLAKANRTRASRILGRVGLNHVRIGFIQQHNYSSNLERL